MIYSLLDCEVDLPDCKIILQSLYRGYKAQKSKFNGILYVVPYLI